MVVVDTMSVLRIGIIGLGQFGQLHASACMGLPYFAKIHAVCDADADRARSAAVTYGAPYSFTDPLEVIDHEEIDAVHIVTPENAHLEPVMAALAAGKHILVEKPLADTSKRALQIVDAAAETSLVVLPGHILRFDPRYMRIKQQIDAGKIGTITSIYARRNIPVWMRDHYRRTNLVFLNMIHDIDVIHWFTGTRVAKVKAYFRWLRDTEIAPAEHLSASINGTDDAIDPMSLVRPPDLIWANLELQDGSLVVLESGYVIPDGSSRSHDVHLHVVGSRGLVRLDSPSHNLGFSTADGDDWEDAFLWPSIDGNIKGALAEELSYFYSCILNNRQPKRITVYDAYHAVRVAEAIVQAGYSNQEVNLG